MITPRTTRLLRAADLRSFRDAVAALACAGGPLDARDRLVIVPTRAAAAHLVRTIENRLPEGGAAVLPVFATPGELVFRTCERLRLPGRILTPLEREALLGVAARTAADEMPPPFSLRPGLVAEMLRFYDELRRRQQEIGAFERLTLGLLEPGAADDRGAERLVRQTRFLAAAFREFERRAAGAGLDEHALRRLAIEMRAPRPWRHVVVAVSDCAFDKYGLWPADWDLLARLPDLERLDVVVTDTRLAGALHERLGHLLPGIEEVRADLEEPVSQPVLVIPPGGSLFHTARDREEEVAACARRVRRAVRRGELRSLDRAALVVRNPLPYVYVAREVFRSAGVPCQMVDALPLAAEPFAAALDLVFSCVSAGFARRPAIALLRSPHFAFHVPRGGSSQTLRLASRDIEALDRALSEAGFLGGADALDRLLARWRERGEGNGGRWARAARAGEVLRTVIDELAPLQAPAPVETHLSTILAFLAAHEVPFGQGDHPAGGDAGAVDVAALAARHRRARSAVVNTLRTLAEAHARHDSRPVDFDHVAALVRRWIEAQTFAPLTGSAGVHVIDAASAAFGDFDLVHVAGVAEGEWPEPPRRNIFYSAAVLRELGWPADADRLDGARTEFADLLRLPADRLVVSTFALEADNLVSPSPLLDELERGGFDCVGEEPFNERVFDHEVLALDVPLLSLLDGRARRWAERRLARQRAPDARFRGMTGAHAAAAYAVSALERYQDCPFKFFAADVLRLEEAPDDEGPLSPRARGRFVHEVFQRFFKAWDARGGGAITAERLDEARALFAEVAEPLLAALPDADAALERTRLFGSAISVGAVDIVLGIEASRPAEVAERWLEYRLEGEFALDGRGRRVALTGIADRIDLLSGRRLRVVDYKSGSAPDARRALQVPVYALCARERLGARDGAPWAIDEAYYVSLSGKQTVVPIVRADAADAEEALASAAARVFEAIDGISQGEFPPRPHDPIICRSCAYPSVCRKDYVGDD